MGKKIHVVPHCHWDREWYFTTSRSKVYLLKDLKDVIETLEKDPDFKYFMLDAQGSLLDDYIKWAPEDEERIRRLVQDHRLIIGPWYTQTDQMVISGESIVRNMYYGMKTCEKYGTYMNVGYVPDSFGQAGNMPQIYRQFGIEDTLFWRGVSNDMVKHTDFNWRGDDGSVVFATQIPFGYYIGGNIPEEQRANDQFWKEECLKKAGTGATDNIYFPNGFDQAPIRRNLPELIKRRNESDPDNEYLISCVEDYIRDVKAAHPDLEEVSGELLRAKHSRVHRSIFSSRSDLKTMNTEMQNYVVNVLEPLLTMSYSLGNEYPHGVMEEIWKLLFENAAHDSIGSCISDTANEDVYVRYKQVKDIAEALVELHTRLIATAIKNDASMTITLFNTLPVKRNQIVIAKIYVPGDGFTLRDSQGHKVNYTILKSRDLTDYVLGQTIKLDPSREFYIPKKVLEATIAIEGTDLPAMGYTQLSLDLSTNGASHLSEIKTIENEYYTLTIEKDGSLTMLDRKNHHLYKNQMIFEENGDGGDSFNYSPAKKDLITTSIGHLNSCEIQSSDIITIAKLDYLMPIPKDLEERAEGKRSLELPFTVTIMLKKGDSVIDFQVHVNNKGLSHRLCVVFDVDALTHFNYADEQFGCIKRENEHTEQMRLYREALDDVSDDSDDSSLPINFRQNANSWQEPPINIEPTQSYVSLATNERGIAIFPQGVREYQIIENHKIRLTLFRTYDFMGKEDLLYRPGRASGERIIETPDAQLLKEMDFRFGVTTFASSFNDAHIANEAKSYDTPCIMKEYAEFLNGRLIFSEPEIEGTKKSSYSLFSTQNNLIVSAIKKAENNRGLIIRLFNGQDHQTISDMLTFDRPIKQAYYVDLKEHKSEEIQISGNKLLIRPLTHCQFISIYVEC